MKKIIKYTLEKIEIEVTDDYVTIMDIQDQNCFVRIDNEDWDNFIEVIHEIENSSW